MKRRSSPSTSRTDMYAVFPAKPKPKLKKSKAAMPTSGTDTMVKNGATTNVNARHQVITAMKEYQNKSFEELRVEDYLANRKGGSFGGGLLGATEVAQTDKPAGELLGQPASSASTGFAFGQNTPSSSFGTALAGPFGSSTSQQQQNGGLFGGGNSTLFGQSSTAAATPASSSVFGGGSSGLFDQNQNQQKGGGLFGEPAASFPSPASQSILALGLGAGGGHFSTTSMPGPTLGAGTGCGFPFSTAQQPLTRFRMTSVYDVAKWPLFSLMEEEVLATIRLACVFGSGGNEAIFITRDDDVFAFGRNQNACLGLGDVLSTLTPRRIESLSRKRLVKLAFGSGPHVIAATEGGDIYSWGDNGNCQLGNGSTNQGMLPSKVPANLSGCRITQLACGSHHNLLLTDKGEVYAWGCNNSGQVGTGPTADINTPRKVTAVLSSKRVVSIACGQKSSFAVLRSGKVYGWGYNRNGQLGLGNKENQLSPCRVSSLDGLVISQLACGAAHSLALSREGAIYTWGTNSFGQLGTGNKSHLCVATKIEGLGRFIEVAATHYANFSAAMAQAGKVYMWGQCRGQSVTAPLETRFTCLDDVFAGFSSPAVTFRPVTFDNFVGRTDLEDALYEAFDNQETSDLKFLVEDKYIFVHKAVLKIRCHHFRSMFQSHWDEDGKDVIEITQFSYPVYRAFLEYLYTDHVSLPPQDAIGLLDLADCYCETQLKRQCERCFRQGINVENVALLLAASIKFQAKDLERFCYKFAMSHLTAVVKTEAFHQLDKSHIKDFITRAAESGAFKY